MPRVLVAESLLPAYESWLSGTYARPAVLCPDQTSGEDDPTPNLEQHLAAVLEQVRFEPAYIQRLGALRGEEGRAFFEESFLNYLQRFSFAGEWEAGCLKGTLIQLLLLRPVLEANTQLAWHLKNSPDDAVHL